MEILKPDWRPLIICPKCHAGVRFLDGEAVCSRTTCGMVYPVVDGRPLLINELNSLFTVEAIMQRQHTAYSRDTPISGFAKRVLPSLSLNLRSKANFRSLLQMLLSR